MECNKSAKMKADVSGIVKELVHGIAEAVLSGDTGEMKFPGGFDVDISVKDNAAATNFNVFGDISLKFLDNGKEVDVKVSREESN